MCSQKVLPVDDSAHLATETWTKRQYMQCSQIVSKKQFHSQDFSPDIHEWVVRNNKLACEVKLAKSVKQLITIENRFLELLELIEGVPFSLEIMCLYVLVMHNLIATLLRKCLVFSQETNDSENSVHCLEKYLTRCVTGICEYLGCEKCEIEQQNSIETMCCELLAKLKSRGHANDMLLLSGLVTFNCSLFYLLSKSPEVTRSLIKSFTSLLPDQSIFLPNTLRPSNIDFTVLLNDDSKGVEFSNYVANVQENLVTMFHDLYAVALFASGDYIKFLEQLKITKLESNEDFAYMKAFVFFKQARVAECLDLCTKMAGHVTSGSNRRWYNILASCVCKQNQKHASVMLFNQAFNKEGRSLLPLYNMSLVYRKLGIFEGELECVKLLVNACEKTDSARASMGVAKDVKNVTRVDVNSCLKICGGEVVQENVADLDLCLPTVLYIYAKRALELNKFSIAVSQYERLSQILRSGVKIEQWQSSSTGIRIPPLRTVLKELAYCLLQNGHYQKCLSLCEELLRATATRLHLQNSEAVNRSVRQSSETVDPTRHNWFSSGLKSGQKDSLTGLSHSLTHSENTPNVKRKSNEVISELDKADVEERVAVIMFKADALANIGNYGEALNCINDVIKQCEEYMTYNRRDSRSVKVARVENDRFVSDTFSGTDSIRGILRDAYVNKANVLVAMGNMNDAIHLSRIAVQLSRNDDEAEHNHNVANNHAGANAYNHTDSTLNNRIDTVLYNHALILLKARRWKDACHVWLRHRDVTPDPSSLDITIDTHQTKLRDMMGLNEEKTGRCMEMLSELEKLKLDVYLLHLLKQKIS